MNKNDRKKLGELIEQIQALVNEIDVIGQSEREKGLKHEETADAIESACSTIEEGLASLNDLLVE